jgi:hypothetical protein
MRQTTSVKWKEKGIEMGQCFEKKQKNYHILGLMRKKEEIVMRDL